MEWCVAWPELETDIRILKQFRPGWAGRGSLVPEPALWDKLPGLLQLCAQWTLANPFVSIDDEGAILCTFDRAAFRIAPCGGLFWRKTGDLCLEQGVDFCLDWQELPALVKELKG